MKKLMRSCGMVLLVAVVCTSVGQAAATSMVGSSLSVRDLGGLVAYYDEYSTYAESYGVAASGQTGLPAPSSVDGPNASYSSNAITSANAGVGNAAAGAMTGLSAGNHWVMAGAGVAPAAGMSEAGYGYGYVSNWAYTLTGGVHTLVADYAYSIMLDTDSVGDSAGASLQIYFDLYDSQGGWINGAAVDISNPGPFVQGGQQYVDSGTGTLEFTVDLAPGDYYFELWSDAEALACSAVPTPGALLLAGLGSGLVGWMRRRRTM